MRTMSFRLKTILGIAAIEALLLLILVWNSLLFLAASNEEQLIKRADTTVTLFATTTKNAVLATDLASLEEFVEEVLKNPGIVYARVIGATGVLAQDGDESALKRPFIKDTQFDAVDDGVFDVSAIIDEGNIEFGRVELGISIASIQQILGEAQEKISLIAILEMVLTAMFSFVLGTILTRRILNLKEASEKVAAGDLSAHLSIKGKDEIAVVGMAFNSMLDKLHLAAETRQQYQQQLEAMNVGLEERVAKRTTELESTNKALTLAMQQLEAEKKEQQVLIEKIQQTQSRLLQSEKMASLGQLAAGVAHEINNPVGFISSNISTLNEYVTNMVKLLNLYEQSEEKISDPEVRQALQTMRNKIDFDFIRKDIRDLISESLDGTKRVKGIVKDLREFSHVDESEWQYVDIHNGLDSTLNLVNNEIRYKAEVVKEYGDLPKIECLASELNQVFLNLLVNAAQAIEDRGIITVRTALEDEQHIKVEIEDTGTGISKDDITRIFDPFYTSKPIGSGTGLGLSLSYSIIQRHNGHIEVESKEGLGTKFIIVLPVKNHT